MEKTEKTYYELTAAEGKMLFDGETYAAQVATGTPDKWKEVPMSQYEEWRAAEEAKAKEMAEQEAGDFPDNPASDNG